MRRRAEERALEIGRAEGWDRDRWEAVAGVDGLGPDLPPFKPG